MAGRRWKNSHWRKKKKYKMTRWKDEKMNDSITNTHDSLSIIIRKVIGYG